MYNEYVEEKKEDGSVCSKELEEEEYMTEEMEGEKEEAGRGNGGRRV